MSSPLHFLQFHMMLLDELDFFVFQIHTNERILSHST